MKRNKKQKRKERLAEKIKRQRKATTLYNYFTHVAMRQDSIHFTNDSMLITGTNYWQTNIASHGLVYVSVNAGAFRMLLPSQVEAYLSDIKTGKHIVISRGYHVEYGRDMFEFMFEDFSDAPFSFWVSPNQFDRLPASFDNGKEFKFLLYSNGLKLEFEAPVYYRIVDTLPNLKPWNSKQERIFI